MKCFHVCSLLLLLLLHLLLLLLGVQGATNTTSDSDSWNLEFSNALGDLASPNKLWCASPTGDLTFGPVQGADTSSPDASIWAVTLPPGQLLIQLRLPSTLDYTCRLQSAASLWSFSLPVSTLSQDDHGDPGDIKCHGPWHWNGIPPADIPPGCDFIGSDGFTISSVKVTFLITLDIQSNTATPAPSSSSNAPAPTPLSSFFDGSSATVNSASPSTVSPPSPEPIPISDSSEDTNSKQPIAASPTSMMSPSLATPSTAAPTPVASPTSMSASLTPTNPTTPPRPGRKLLHGY